MVVSHDLDHVTQAEACYWCPVCVDLCVLVSRIQLLSVPVLGVSSGQAASGC